MYFFLSFILLFDIVLFYYYYSLQTGPGVVFSQRSGQIVPLYSIQTTCDLHENGRRRMRQCQKVESTSEVFDWFRWRDYQLIDFSEIKDARDGGCGPLKHESTSQSWADAARR